ncbi:MULTISPECIES: ABC transporter ATP-binding protein [unclassified Meridianimarinicoccus]|uniref:ABC transporter ATP-binding protein n=1 Tax=unclassified Meridianimarinicoccus TaxID=2923344 RepID=UPI001867070D|nr:sn-glycerol-3-phosphate ABC transporter ATP-binding protein UgpC [Fluviibacterium sp. MJW13]
MTELKLNDVAKAYGDVQVLSNINLDIAEGELIVFVGPSGCGKSTLLRMIAGLEKITGGTLEIGGAVMNDIPPAQRGIAMVFQSYALYPHMTVRDNMAFALKLAKKSKDEISAAVDKAAQILQLTPYLDRLPKALSGGQRQRVAIGRAIVRDPKVFLFDEPLSNLDAALRVATRIEIAQLKEAMPDRTMIYVTHDQVEAMTLATRIVVLAGGGISQVGTPMELYQKPENTFVAQFIGSPAMNLMKAEIVATGENTRVKVASGAEVETNIPSRGDMMGATVELGVRPEHLAIAPEGQGFLDFETEISERLGDVTVLYSTVDADGAQMIAKLPGLVHSQRGSKVRLSAESGDLHLFLHGKSLLYP